jgi:hypothetical protein
MATTDRISPKRPRTRKAVGDSWASDIAFTRSTIRVQKFSKTVATSCLIALRLEEAALRDPISSSESSTQTLISTAVS